MTKEILAQYEKYKDSMLLGRVSTVHKKLFYVMYNDISYKAKVSGRFSYNVIENSEYPAVGDYVIFKPGENIDDISVIEKVCERYSELSRLGVNNLGDKQLLCTNIDVIFILISLNNDFNLKKLQNFLSLTYSSYAKTIILLTKKDLCNEIENKVIEVNKLTDKEVYPVSSLNNEDINIVKELIDTKTAVFLGASGVGKSTLINKLLDKDYFETNTIRESDSQGRHTTVHREMLKLESGGYIIDTPGIRIIQSYYVEHVDEHYLDVLDFEKGCLYQDCTHTHEPGCKVKEAVENGELPIERLNSYHKTLKYNKFNKQREEHRERKSQKKRKR